MKRRVAVLAVLLIGLIVAFLGYRWNSDRARDEYDQLHGDYDREFRAGVAQATQIEGKETIKVERLSDQFTAPFSVLPIDTNLLAITRIKTTEPPAGHFGKFPLPLPPPLGLG